MKKRILSMLLAAVMVLSLFPAAAAAEEPVMPVEQEIEAVPEGPADPAPEEAAPAAPEAPVPVEPEEPAPAEAAAVPAPVSVGAPAPADEPAVSMPMPAEAGKDETITVTVTGNETYKVEFTAQAAQTGICPIEDGEEKAKFSVAFAGGALDTLSITIPAFYAIDTIGGSPAEGEGTFDKAGRTRTYENVKLAAGMEAGKPVAIALKQAGNAIGFKYDDGVGAGIKGPDGEQKSYYFKEDFVKAASNPYEDPEILTFSVQYGKKLMAEPNVLTIQYANLGGVGYAVDLDAAGGRIVTVTAGDAEKLATVLKTPEAFVQDIGDKYYLYPIKQDTGRINIKRGYKLPLGGWCGYPEVEIVYKDTIDCTLKGAYFDGSQELALEKDEVAFTLHLDDEGQFNRGAGRISFAGYGMRGNYQWTDGEDFTVYKSELRPSVTATVSVNDGSHLLQKKLPSFCSSGQVTNINTDYWATFTADATGTVTFETAPDPSLTALDINGKPVDFSKNYNTWLQDSEAPAPTNVTAYKIDLASNSERSFTVEPKEMVGTLYYGVDGYDAINESSGKVESGKTGEPIELPEDRPNFDVYIKVISGEKSRYYKLSLRVPVTPFIKADPVFPVGEDETALQLPLTIGLEGYPNDALRFNNESTLSDAIEVDTGTTGLQVKKAYNWPFTLENDQYSLNLEAAEGSSIKPGYVTFKAKTEYAFMYYEYNYDKAAFGADGISVTVQIKIAAKSLGEDKTVVAALGNQEAVVTLDKAYDDSYTFSFAGRVEPE